MTINIGINFGDYIFLAADTRTTYFFSSAQKYTDETQKIQKTKMGLVTGAGYKNLLDEVKYQLAQENIRHTDQIIQVIKQQADTFSIQASPKIREVINTTGWLLTYLTQVEEKPILRLALIHPKFKYVPALYKKNKPCVIMPFGANGKVTKLVLDTIKKNIKPLGNVSEIQDNIIYHTGVIKGIISSVSKNFQSVSPTFHIGVHTIDGKMGISTRVENEKLTIHTS